MNIRKGLYVLLIWGTSVLIFVFIQLSLTSKTRLNSANFFLPSFITYHKYSNRSIPLLVMELVWTILPTNLYSINGPKRLNSNCVVLLFVVPFNYIIITNYYFTNFNFMPPFSLFSFSFLFYFTSLFSSFFLNHKEQKCKRLITYVAAIIDPKIIRATEIFTA